MHLATSALWLAAYLVHRLGALVGEHAEHLRLERPGLGQLPRLREPHELLVRGERPEEEGESRGEVEVRDPVRRPGLDPGGRLLQPEDEVRARQDGLQRRAHPDLEAALGRTVRVEAHERVAVLGGERSPERRAPEPLDDAPGAGELLLRVPVGQRQTGFVPSGLSQTIRVPTGEILSFERRELDKAATGLFIGAGVGIAATALIFILDPSGRGEPENTDPPDDLMLRIGLISIPIGD